MHGIELSDVHFHNGRPFIWRDAIGRHGDKYIRRRYISKHNCLSCGETYFTYKFRKQNKSNSIFCWNCRQIFLKIRSAQYRLRLVNSKLTLLDFMKIAVEKPKGYIAKIDE